MASYALQVIKSGDDFDTGPFQIIPLPVIVPPDTEYLATSPLADGTYKWRVVASDSASPTTASSVVRDFTIDATPPDPPGLVTPANNVTLNDNTPFFDWFGSAGAFDYRLQVTTGSITTGPYAIDVVVSAPSPTQFQATGDLADGSYTYRVIARDAAGNTAVSATFSFIVDTIPPAAPNLVSPVDNAILTDSTPLFDWDPSISAEVVDYLLQVASGDINNGPYQIEIVIPHTTTEYQVLPQEELANGTHQWRVVARDAVLNGASLAPRSFTVIEVDVTPPATPSLLSPADNARISDNSPTFDWTDVTDRSGVSYRIQVDDNSNFVSPEVDESGLPASIFTVGATRPTPTILVDDTYFWRARAVDGAGNTGDFTAARSVTIDTTPPVAPALNAPADGVFTNTRTVTFSWNASTSSDIGQYHLQVTAGADFNQALIVDKLIAHPTLSDQVTLPADGVYKWRVGALDTASPPNETPAAGLVVRQLSVDSVESAPVLELPVSGDSVIPPFTLDWSDVVDPLPVTYSLVVDDDPGFGSPAITTGGLTVSQFQVGAADLVGGLVYHWKVTTEDGAGNTADSGERNFTVTDLEKDWESTLTVSAVDTNNVAVPGGITLEFGVKPGATDGFDLGIDGVAPLAPPSAPYIQPYFFYESNDPGPPDTRNLQRSMVQSGGSLAWPLRVVGNSGFSNPNAAIQVTIQWNVNNIPPGFSQVGLFDSGDQFVADMKTTNSYQFEVVTGQFGFGLENYTIRVSKFQTQVLQFKKGWTLISLSVLPAGSAAPSDVLKDIGPFSIFGFNSTTQGYEVPAVMEAGQGYWVAVFADATQTIEGVPILTFNRSVTRGWNLIGSLFADAEVQLVSGGPLGLNCWVSAVLDSSGSERLG